MAEFKGFFDCFKKYEPYDDKEKEILTLAENIRLRRSKDGTRIEVDADFPVIIRASVLYETEAHLCQTYGLVSARILPHFPGTLFQTEYMSDVLEEAVKVGAITRGFFFNASYRDDGDVFTITIPFVEEAIQFVNTSGTAEILSNILKSRFGVSRKVVISSDEHAREKTTEREAKKEETLKEYDRQALAAFRERMLHPAEAPIENPHADFEQRKNLDNSEETAELDGDVCKIGRMCFRLSDAALLYGNDFSTDRVVSINSISSARGSVVLVGEIFEITTKDNREGTKVQATIGIYDGSGSIYIKHSVPKEDAGFIKDMKEGKCISVLGQLQADKFDGQTFLSFRAIKEVKRVKKKDNAEKKRVELHLHTVMSAMDAIIHPEEVVALATQYGHTAIGVTDHGNVQAFPEVMLAAEKKAPDLKILYGMEAYYVNNEANAISGVANSDYNQTTVVFDLETTGLSATSCEIIEFGAVKMENGEIVDRFSSFCNPGVPIPAKITELTSITDEMVKDAPPVKEVLAAFLDFCGDALLVAHNAKFDTGFVRAAAEKYGFDFHNPSLDTVAVSQYVNADLKKHTLDSIANHYHLGDFHHHRAVDDAEVLFLIYKEMLARLEKEGVRDYDALAEAMSENSDPLKLRPYHMIIYAKNQAGLKNLYQLISKSYLQYYYKRPRIPRSEIEKHREGLLIGSACEAGELYSAILDNRSEAEIEKIASFYDYFEIQPLCNNMFLVGADGRGVGSVEVLKDINRRIVALGKKLGKLTVATCDAHFANEEDEIYRKILLAAQKYKDADKDTGIYMRTTEEMLEEFSYLGEELAYEVVVENPNKIADSIEKLRPIPKGTYTPSIPGSEEELQRLCWDRAMDWYGFEGKIPELVSNRLNKELDSIIKHGFAVLYMIAQKLVAYSEKQGYLVGSRGSVGSSFVAIMSGISEVNPLPPHWRCPNCRYNEFVTDGSYGSGFDMPDKECPHCHTPMYSDGQDIPFETFLGFYGDKSPDIDLNFSGDVQPRVHKYTEELFGEGHVFRAGTLGTLASKTAFGFVSKYLEERKIELPRAEVSHIISRCIGVKRTTGQHPGGIIVVPTEYDVHDFTPVQHPADDASSDIITTHFPFEFLHDTILKLDELGHDMPTKYKMLERYTNTSVLDVKMNDASIYELFKSTAPLGVTSEQIGCPLGTYGLPEMGTSFIQQVLVDAKPKNFADLMQISGLTHGTDVWLGNAQDLIKEGICDISQVVGTRDGIMLYLIRHELDNGMAFKIMEDVRKGKGLKPEYEEAMLAHGVPEWYIASCKKIKYMFPKAHAAAYVMSAIRLGWYKIYYPMEFYAAFLTVAPGGFDAEIVSGGIPSINAVLEALEKSTEKLTQKEQEQHTTLLLVREALCRGVKFLPVHLLRSDSTAFLPENGCIRMPFNSLNGLGTSAAEKIVQCRKEREIFSVEELRTRAGLSKSIISMLRQCGALDGLSETNQISLF